MYWHLEAHRNPSANISASVRPCGVTCIWLVSSQNAPQAEVSRVRPGKQMPCAIGAQSDLGTEEYEKEIEMDDEKRNKVGTSVGNLLGKTTGPLVGANVGKPVGNNMGVKVGPFFK